VSSVEADPDGDGRTSLRVGLSAGADPARVEVAVLRVVQASSDSRLHPARVRLVAGALPPTAPEAVERPASAGEADTRPQVLRTEVEVRASEVRATVVLAARDRTSTGQCSGRTGGRGVPRAVAGATVRALEGLLREGALELDMVHVHRDDGAAVVTVRLVLRLGLTEERLIGSAGVRVVESDAVVRAVLDACNRRTAAMLA
jgi:hypothetical protein